MLDGLMSIRHYSNYFACERHYLKCICLECAKKINYVCPECGEQMDRHGPVATRPEYFALTSLKASVN
jgi:hypothetical protein